MSSVQARVSELDKEYGRQKLPNTSEGPNLFLPEHHP